VYTVGDLEGEARLADAGRSGHGQEAVSVQRGGQLRHLVLAANEAAEDDREAAGPRRRRPAIRVQ
jgi:hypothetical protein